MSNNQTESERYKQLLTLMMRHQHQIFAYIYSLVPHRSEADDVLPPPEIPFENQPVKKVAKPVKVKHTPPKAPIVAKAPKVSRPAKKRPAPRPIDQSAFKTLRTIDEELVIYVIKKGDTLKSIAQQYYQNPSKDRVIADLNFIENPSFFIFLIPKS